MATSSNEYRSAVEYRQKVNPVLVTILNNDASLLSSRLGLAIGREVNLDFFGTATTSTYVGIFNEMIEYALRIQTKYQRSGLTANGCIFLLA